VTPELSRFLPLTRIKPGLEMRVTAKAAELTALAARMNIPQLRSFDCVFLLTPETAGHIRARGQLRAEVTQNCVLSAENFDSRIEEEFSLIFVPEGTERVDFDLETEDEVPYARDGIDFGEAAAEQLALCLEPFPRKPGASLPESEAVSPDGAVTITRDV
jgi:uncharacterized metal-binding protein YceD (DUF177 family)